MEATMSESQAKGVGFAGMILWIVPAGLILTAMGVYPTWKLGGGDGVRAMLAAKAVVLTVMVASAAIVARISRRGPTSTAFAFVLCGLVVGAVCLACTAGLWSATDLPAEFVGVWVALLFMAMMIAESLKLACWLLRNPPHRNQKP